jgi:hypothetical protein
MDWGFLLAGLTAYSEIMNHERLRTTPFARFVLSCFHAAFCYNTADYFGP